MVLATLAPGQQITVRSVLDLSRVPAGPVRKTVSVYAQGYDEPAAMLEITGTLRPSVTFSPTLADFGNVKAGEGHTITLTATVDARLAPAGAFPPLVSSHPAVRVEPRLGAAPTGAPSPKADAERRSRPEVGSSDSSLAKEDPTFVKRAYTLMLLPDGPLGPVNGTVSFVPGVASAGASVPADGDMRVGAAAALRSAQVLVVGQVAGEASTQPQLLAFGPVAAGREAARTLVVTGASPTLLQNLKVASTSSWLSVQLAPGTAAAPLSKGAANSWTRTLLVRLSDKAPAGVLQSQLKVTLANGQRLLVAVTAFVLP